MQEYINEWERLYVLCDLHDPEELRVGRFLEGLREDIKNQLMITPDLTVHSAGLHAIEVEKYANRIATSHNRTTRTCTPKSTSNMVVPRKDAQNREPRTNTERVEPHTNPKDVVCFKCNGRGHYKRDCPNARAFTMRE